MKNKIIIFFIIFFYISIYADKQHVHQYLTKEAYYQLRDYLGYDIPEMLAHLDNGPVGTSWTNGTLLAGVWVEDEYDAIYNYRREDVIAWIPDPFLPEDMKKAMVSITHFWDADYGDYAENNFPLIFLDLWYEIGPIPNSYTKASLYKNGGYILKLKFLPYLRLQAENGDWLQFWSVPGFGFEAAGLMYYSLVDFYKNKRMHTNFTENVRNRVYNERLQQWVTHYGDVYFSDDLRDKIFWEILGRMVHLLQDLSEPTHAHLDEHGMDPDPYEEWISGGEPDRYQYYNHNNIEAGIIDPYQSTNPLHFLMYTTQQISDHFGSRGPINGNGDNILAGNPLPEEITYLNNIGLGSLGGNMFLHEDFTQTELLNIRDKTIPHIIRATAGLLYWFAKEADLLPAAPIPLTTTISGPTTINYGVDATWNASATGGNSPYHYQWWYKYPGGIPLLSTSSVKKLIIGDPIGPNLPSGGYWNPIQIDSPILTRHDYQDHYLKCVVTDADNTTDTSNIMYIYVSGSSGPLLPTLAKNNLQKNNLEKSISEKKVTENSLGNYPNPFNPSTIIRYQILKAGQVTLKVYDTLGREVANLVDKQQPSGQYSVNFNASKLSSGIYLYRITANGFTAVKKMILTK